MPFLDEIEDLQLVPAPGLWAFVALNVLLQCVGVVAIGAAIGAGRLRLLADTGRARERRAGRFGGSFSFPKEVAPILNGTSNWLPCLAPLALLPLLAASC